jgi:hypothetical protein
MVNFSLAAMERKLSMLEVTHLEMILVHPIMIFYKLDFFINVKVGQERYQNTGMKSAVEIVSVEGG